MRFSNLICGLIIGLGPHMATAQECWICDEVVEVTEDYARCYLDNFEVLLNAFDNSGLERQQVNLAGCAGGTADGTRGLLTMGNLGTSSTPSVKSVYTLDRSSAICLRDLLAAFDGPLSPSAVFRLNEACENGG